ncbi:MAG: NADP-dependent oxidoreductase [Acidimicrobiales bacterium]|nr:NADP-dependent oxidoreductase [Acidimicrobiales bacterium]
MEENIEWRLIKRPIFEAQRSDFKVTTSPIPEPGPGEVLIRNIYLFVPPSMRLWMNEKQSYWPSEDLGNIMRGIMLGQVEASNDPAYPVGCYVNSNFARWQSYHVISTELLLPPIEKHPQIPLELYASNVLDVNGFTAMVGIDQVCKPKEGQTLVVDAAAGNVGSLAAQIAKKRGARVIGIAGGSQKCGWIEDECGIDAAIDYKNQDVGERLDELAPDGIDLVFENVGGPIFDAILNRINDYATIALCGMISHYNDDPDIPRDTDQFQRTSALMSIVTRFARIQGFLVHDYEHLYCEMRSEMESWILEDTLKYKVEVLEGFDSILDAMANLYSGRNQGVQLVQVSDI